jgi:hypothetical protein
MRQCILMVCLFLTLSIGGTLPVRSAEVGDPALVMDNVHTVASAFDVPLHPGAAKYYRERGYLGK